ncbi:Bromodomain adjacent to zinc finger domain protein 2A [Schistosoma japonicum]|nr:Bromodomain adjacent to zinc finger domain protein 2A [Schistosoma japonicum]
MSSLSNEPPSSISNTDKNPSNNKISGSFESSFITAQPSMLLNGNTSCLNPNLSYLHGLNCWPHKTFSNSDITSFPTSTSFLPYLDDQQKLQQLQMQLLQMEQNNKEQQSVGKEQQTLENKMGYLSGVNASIPNLNIHCGVQNANIWNNLRMLPEMLAYTNPIIKETCGGLSLQDIQQLTFLNQIYNQLNIGQLNALNSNSINQSTALIPGNNHLENYHTTTHSSQDITLTNINPKQNQSNHLMNNDNLLLTSQLFSSMYNFQEDNLKQQQQQHHQQQQQQQQTNSFYSESMPYSNSIPLNSTTSLMNNSLYNPTGSIDSIMLNNSMPLLNKTITSLTDKMSSSTDNNLVYAQALMMIMNAMYSNYKTGQSSAQNDLSNGFNLLQNGIINYANQQLINSTTNTSTCLNTEPKESFSDVLTFLSQCLNSSTSHNDKNSSHRQPNTSMKQPHQVTNTSSTKPTTTPRLSGRQKATSNNHQPNQPTTSNTTHRGRGRPPKLAGVQYQAQNKQQQSHPKQNQAVTNSERQSQIITEGTSSILPDNMPHADSNYSHVKSEFNLSSSKIKCTTHHNTVSNNTNVFPYSTGYNETKLKVEVDLHDKKLYNTISSKNESSVEETIDDVLKSIADCKDDLATLASHLAYNTLGISSNKENRREYIHNENNNNNDALIVNMSTSSESTSKSSDTNSPTVIRHGQSSSRIPHHSEWNLEDVTKNATQISMLNEVSFLNHPGQDLCNLNNTEEASNATGSYFNQSKLTEVNLNKFTPSAQCSYSTVVDSKACTSQIRSQDDVKSTCNINDPFYSTNEIINSSITSTYSSSTINSNNNGHIDSNQLKLFPYHNSQVLTKVDLCNAYTRNDELHHLQSHQLYPSVNEQLSNELCNNQSESVQLNSNNLPNLTMNTINFMNQQNPAEKEYLKNFFIEFAKQQEKLQKEKDDLIKEEQKQFREMNVRELIEQELKKPVEDLRLIDSKPIPKLDSIPGNRMTRNMFGNCLMIIEFLHAFSDVLFIDPEAIPNMGELQSALIDRDPQCQRFLVHLMIGLLKLAIDDPGMPSSRLVTQLLGQRFNDTELNEQTISSILRVFIISRNGYEDDMSDWLHPPIQFTELTGEQQATLLAFVCDELICSSRLISNEIDRTIEKQSILKREKWIIESKIRRLRLLIAQKLTTTENVLSTSMIEYERKSKVELLSSDKYKLKDTHQLSHSPIKRCSKQLNKLNIESESTSIDSSLHKKDNVENLTCLSNDIGINSNVDPIVQLDIESTSYQKNIPLTTMSKVTSVPIVSTSLTVSSNSLSDDEDNMCKISELESKIETLNRTVEQKQKEIDECSSRLSGLYLGQDRYYRNYYVLKHMGGIYIEGESSVSMHLKSECCSNSMIMEATENHISNVDNNFNELPDSHLDYIVNEIKVRRELAQKRQLKLPVSTVTTYPCLQSHSYANKLQLNVEKQQLNDKIHTDDINQIEQCDVNIEAISKDTKQMNSDSLNSKYKLDIINENVYSQSLEYDVSIVDNEKTLANPDHLDCTRSGAMNYLQNNASVASSISNYDVNNTSTDANYTSLARTTDGDQSELSIGNYSDNILIKSPIESNSTQDIDFQSTSSCIDDTNKPITTEDDRILCIENNTESTNQVNNDIEVKNDDSIKTVYNSSMNIIPSNNVDTFEYKEVIHSKTSIPLKNDNTPMIDDIKLDDDNNKHVNDISLHEVNSIIDHDKISTSSGQPLDLSNKSLHSEQLHYSQDSIESKSTLNNNLDESTLTKCIIFFMNHTGLTPPSNDNQHYSNTWLSILNYCKLLLNSALLDEITSMNNEINMKLPLKTALNKLHNLMLINDNIEFLNEIYPLNKQCNRHSSIDYSLYDKDLIEYVNYELEKRKIQWIKEDFSCISELHKEYQQSTWYQLIDVNKLNNFLNIFNLRGVREKQLVKCIQHSKDFIESSMNLALKRNSDFDVVKSLFTTKLNSRLMQIRTHRRRGRRGGRGHGTRIGSGHYYPAGSSWNCLSRKNSTGLIPYASWDVINSNDSMEIERLHTSNSNISNPEILYSSDDGSSDTNSGLTATSLVSSKRNLVETHRGYSSFPVASPVDSVEGISSKCKNFDDKGLKIEDTSTDEHTTFISECQLLRDVEALEDKVLYASLQTKGWKVPSKISEDETISLIPRTAVKQSRFEHWPLELARNRLLDIECHLERRYLLPPFNSEVHLNIVPETIDASYLPEVRSNTESTDTGIETEGEYCDMKYDKCESNAEAVEDEINVSRQTRQTTSKHPISNDSVDNNGSTYDFQLDNNHLDELNTVSNDQTNNYNVPQGLIKWRTKLNQATDAASLRRCMNQLVLAIAWDKSIMKVLCQICRRDNNEACLLLCDGCDRGYHTYCFKPQLSNIPTGDWFCYDCVSKATSKHLCYICGGSELDDIQQQQQQQTDSNSSNSEVKRMAVCYHCSRAVHNSCARPTFVRIPKRWYCSNCTFLKYVKSKDETPNLSLQKSRRKRKVYGSVDSEDNLMMKKRKTCTVLKSNDTNMNVYDTPSMNDNKFSNPNRRYQGWWSKLHKYRKRTDNMNSGMITITKSKIRKHKSRSHNDSENKKNKLNDVEEFTEFSLPRKPGRKPNYHLAAIPTKPKRHYHRRSVLLVSKKISGCRGGRRCRTLCQETTNENEASSSISDSIDSVQPVCQNYQQMNSNELEWCRRATEDLLNHEASWAFRKPVNLKQVPIYRKIY